MPDLVWPIDIIPSRVRWGFVDSTARSDSPTTGVTRTSSLYGTRRWKATLEFDNLNAARRHRVLAFLAAAKQANRVWVPDRSTVRRGAMSAPELLTNADFLQGTTGWAAVGGFTAASGAGRLTLTSGGQQAVITASPGPTLIAHAPYAARTFLQSMSDANALSGPYLQDGGSIVYNNAYSAGPGLKTVSGVAGTGGVGVFGAYADVRTSGSVAGQYADIALTSLARCFLADSRPNLLLSSQTPGSNTGWGLSDATAGANGTLAPDATSSAWFLAENTANASHTAAQTVTVASAAADFTFSLFVNFAGTLRNRCYLYLQENTAGTPIIGWFSNATGFTSSSVGANWANFRQTVTNVGGGWIRLSITGRKTNAATSLTAIFGPTTADGVTSYAGATTPVAMLAWGASLSQSSVPVRLRTTTTVASAGVSQQGAAIDVKGGPANTNAALSAGDMVEIILPTYSHFARLTADLDFDAAGLGYMQFEPGLPTGVADNAAIIVEKPMCRMIPVDSFEWDTRPGLFSDFSVSFVQAT